MERVRNVGRNLIAYCMGNPVAIAIRQFQDYLEEVRQTGQEVWHISDKAGIVFKDNRWYVWMKEQMENAKIEGRIYENPTIQSALKTVYISMPWLSSEQKMSIVRSCRFAVHMA